MIQDALKQIAELQEKVSIEKKRIVGMIATGLDDNAAALLCGLSDADLRRVGALMFSQVGNYVNMAMAGKMKQKTLRTAKNGTMVEGELRRNVAENCWDVCDTDTHERIGKIYPGMCVEFFDKGNWISGRVEMSMQDIWVIKEDKSESRPYGGSVFLCGKACRVRAPI